jgi:ABC-2 type transport system permease protein
MRTFVHILWYKVKIFFKLNSEVSLRTMLKNAASLIVFGSFTFGAYMLSHEITRYVMEETRLGLFLLHRFLSMILFVFFLSINVGNIIVSYATLYRSKETHYLLSMPVSHTALFVIKFLENFFYSSTTLLAVALASFAGYGSYFGVSWLFYLVAVLLLFFPFMLLAAALGVMALLLLMKIAENVGTKALLVSVVLGYVGSVYGYFKTTNPMALVNNVIKFYPHVDQYFGFLEPKFVHYFPSNWFADALYWNLRGNLSESFVSLSLLVGVSFVATAAMVLMGKKFFYNTWLVSMELRAKSNIEQTARGMFAFIKKPLIPEQISVLIKKDFWHFLREPSQWIHFCIISILIVIFIGSISRLHFPFERALLDTVSYMVIYVFNAFLISSIALRFVYPMMSIEGLSFWKVRSAPITLSKVYWLKFFLAFIPIVILGELLSIASHHPLAEFSFLRDLAMLGVVFVTFSFVSINLSAGSFFVNYRETNPIRVSSSQGATLTFLAGIIYLVFIVVVLFAPLNNFFTAVILKKSFEPQSLMPSVLLLCTVSLVVGVVGNAVGMRSLRRDF